MDFTGVASRKWFVPAPAGNSESQVAPVIFHTNATVFVCGLEDAVLLTAISWMDRRDIVALQITLLLRRQARHSPSEMRRTSRPQPLPPACLVFTRFICFVVATRLTHLRVNLRTRERHG